MDAKKGTDGQAPAASPYVATDPEAFARNLAGGTGRNVVDKTGLAGSYDLELEFTPDQSPDNIGPSLFTAMQEQLGLKLDSQRAPVEVVVIDRLEKPTPD